MEAGFSDGNGLSADRPLPSINAALKIAGRGDTIAIAPGEYREHIRVDKPGLKFTGEFSEANEPLVKVVALEKSSAPLLVDNKNSLWRGVGFYAKNGATAELYGFTGRFEHCLFDMRGLFATLNIYGGKPFFKACSFSGHPGPAAGININVTKGPAAGPATFAYCLFKDMEGGAVLARGEQNLDFINCMFVNYQFILMRHEDVRSTISMVNSVFYLGASPKLFLQRESAPKIKLENCLYAPAPGDYLSWRAKALHEQAEIDAVDCKTASPRFEKGRRVLLNFCIDDTANAPMWSKLVDYAEKMGLKITLSLNTDALNRKFWEMIIPKANKGFELASHGAAHSSMVAEDALKLAWYAPGVASATLTIDDDKNFVVIVEGKEQFSLPLQKEPRPSLGDLAKQLQESGFRVELADLSLGKIPAAYLASVENQDIMFEFHEPTLVMDTNAYMRYMLSESRSVIEAGLKEYNAVQRECTALVCPYAETGPGLASALDETGYTISRSRPERNFISALERVNLHYVNSISLKNITSTMPTESLEEMFRLYFDFLKYHGSVMGLYSHGVNEFAIEDWLGLFDVASDDPLLATAGLADMAKEIKAECEPLGDGAFRCPEDKGPVRGEISFRPGPGSPLLGAGKSNGITTNFAGETLPEGQVNIGIY